MKVLLLNEDTNIITDSQPKAHRQMVDNLKAKGHEVTSMNVSEGKYADCVGCWSCWLKTPGECAINDDQIVFMKELLKSDLLILISPVRKGFVSAQLKRSIDRLIPVSLPFFKVKEGQFSHLDRYEKFPNVALMLEYETDLDKENETVIKNWVDRFCWHSSVKCLFVSDVNTHPVSELVNLIN